MSTVKTTNLQNPSAASPNIVLGSSGSVAVAGALTGAGMDLVVKQDFSAVSSVSVNNCFNSLYSNYILIINADTLSAQGGILVRMRASGSDTSTGYYGTGWYSAFNSTLTGDPTSNGSSFWVLSSTTPVSAIGTIMNPYRSVPTQATFASMGGDRVGQYSYNLPVSTAFDGFSVVSSVTITGTIRVYGYRNA